MSSLGYTPAKNAFSRVFLIKRRARGDHDPVFQSCLIAGAVEQAFGDFVTVAGMIKEHLPNTKVAILAAKPSPSRWHWRQEYEEYNERVRVFCQKEIQFEYADIYTPMIEKYGRPDGELFISDSLHMSERGYKIWKEVMKDFIIE